MIPTKSLQITHQNQVQQTVRIFDIADDKEIAVSTAKHRLLSAAFIFGDPKPMMRYDVTLCSKSFRRLIWLCIWIICYDNEDDDGHSYVESHKLSVHKGNVTRGAGKLTGRYMMASCHGNAFHVIAFHLGFHKKQVLRSFGDFFVGSLKIGWTYRQVAGDMRRINVQPSLI